MCNDEAPELRSQEQDTLHCYPVQQWKLLAADAVARLAESKDVVHDGSGRHVRHIRFAVSLALLSEA